MLDRRSFLKHSGFLSLAPAVPGFLARTALAAGPGRDGRVLVVIQLDGGNDGINTVVPYEDEAYARCRSKLRLPSDRLCKIGGGVGLHPAMRPAADLLESGRLAVVQGVGYPNPSRSHFASMAAWQTARPGRAEGDGEGWLGRALGAAGPAAAGPAAIHAGDEGLPRALVSRRASAASFTALSDLTLALPAPPGGPTRGGDDLAGFVGRAVTGAYAAAADIEAAARRAPARPARYPGTRLASRLELVSRSLKAGSPARVYYAIQPGYDSHAGQLPTHERLLGEFAAAVRAFLDDLAAAGLADRVLLMAFSEFGRRPAENGSQGTDHGTAGPVFLAGPGVEAGPFGRAPNLSDLDADGDLKAEIDFRRVYATVLEGWMGIASRDVLGDGFRPLPLLRG